MIIIQLSGDEVVVSTGETGPRTINQNLAGETPPCFFWGFFNVFNTFFVHFMTLIESQQ